MNGSRARTAPHYRIRDWIFIFALALIGSPVQALAAKASDTPDAIQVNSRYLPQFKGSMTTGSSYVYETYQYTATLNLSASMADSYGFFVGFNLDSVLASQSGAYFGGPPSFPEFEIGQRVWGDVDSWVDIGAAILLPLSSLESNWINSTINVIPILGSEMQLRFGSIAFGSSAGVGLFWINGFDLQSSGGGTITLEPDPTYILLGTGWLGYQSTPNFLIKAVEEVLFRPSIPGRIGGIQTPIGDPSVELASRLEVDYIIQNRYSATLGVNYTFNSQGDDEVGFTLGAQIRL